MPTASSKPTIRAIGNWMAPPTWPRPFLERHPADDDCREGRHCWAEMAKRACSDGESSPLKKFKFSIAQLLSDEDDEEEEEEEDEEEDDETNENVEDDDDDVAFCLKATATSSSRMVAPRKPAEKPARFGVAIKEGNLDVTCKLEGSELWAKFYDLGTEMIITKSGRRMFPTVKVSFSNVILDALYYVFLDVIPVDSKRYRYIYNKSAWLTAGKAEPVPRNRLYLHPDCPFTGEQLLKHVISFEKTKLTNNEVDKTGHLILNSMHKYQPRIHIVQRSKHNPLDPNKVTLSDEIHSTFTFHETQFMAVTAYQNQLITKLKIEKNPFAKGFRDPSGRSPDEIERGDLAAQPPPPPLSIFYPPSLLHFAKTPINPLLSQMLFYPNFLSTIGGAPNTVNREPV